MTKHRAQLTQLARRLDALAPAAPVVIRIVWADDATGEREPAGELVVNGRAPRVIQLRWPEGEDDEKQARDVAPGRA